MSETERDFSGPPVEVCLEALCVGVLVVEPTNGEILYANSAMAELFGCRTGETLGKHLWNEEWELRGSDSEPIAVADLPLRRAVESRAPVGCAVFGVRPGSGDSWRWLQVCARPELDDGGNVRCVVATFADTTSARSALTMAEQRYASVIRAMREGVVIHDPDGAIRMANPSARRVLGLTEAQMRGLSPLDPRWKLVDEDGEPLPRERIPSEITRMTGDPCHEHVLGVDRATGERAWLAINTDPIADPEARGPGCAVVATFTDITSEREAMLELERSQSHLESLISALPGAVYQYLRRDDGGEELLHISKQSLDVFGLPAEEALADLPGIWTRVDERDVPVVAAALDNSAKTLSQFEIPFHFRRPDGEVRWLRATATPRKVRGGVLFTGLIVDASEERQMKEHLQQVRHRQAMADLAAGVAHNFNNMLGAIVPNIELALSEAGPLAREALADARLAAENATELVRQLLQLGRPAPVDSPQSSDIVEVARDVVTLCRRTFDGAIKIEERIGLQSVLVSCGANDLQQVILNLLLNARDAVALVDEPAITVSVAMESDRAVLHISDNGCGMAGDVLARLGEPFFTTKGPARGTGLGLASAYRAVSNAGGEIECESELERGTRFTVQIPVVVEERGHRAEEPEQAPRRGLLLLVDDEAVLRRSLARLLEHSGYEVEQAASGESAIEMLGARSDEGRDTPSLVLLDLSLPGLSGAQVLAKIRERWPALPVVVLTGHVPQGVDLTAAEAVVEKPVSWKVLGALVEEIVERNSSARAKA